MVTYTPKERLARALTGKPVDRMPAISVTQTGTVEQMEAVGAFWPEANDNAGVSLLAPGCGIVSKTPNANLQTMVEMARNHK